MSLAGVAMVLRTLQLRGGLAWLALFAVFAISCGLSGYLSFPLSQQISSATKRHLAITCAIGAAVVVLTALVFVSTETSQWRVTSALADPSQRFPPIQTGRITRANPEWVLAIRSAAALGALIGFFHSAYLTPANPGRRMRRWTVRLAAAVIWALAFWGAAICARVADYLLRGGFADAFESVGLKAWPGSLIGAGLAGLLCGSAAAAIALLTPGLPWRRASGAASDSA